MLNLKRKKEMSKYFAILNSGVVVDMNSIVYFGKVCEHRESKRHKPHAWSISIQFDYTDEPVTLTYDTKEGAMLDYTTLCNEALKCK